MAMYKDIDFSLSKNEINNDINIKTDINAISQSLKNIILTSKREKIFDSSFGAGGYDLLFNKLNPIQIATTRLSMIAELELQEPRAIIRSLNIEDSNAGEFIISLEFSPVFDENLVRSLNLEFTADREET